MDVRLVSHTQDPLQVICSVKGAMRGERVSPADVSVRDAENEFLDCLNTEIKSPFEFVSFVFHISKVSRATTHQIVRHRLMSFVQESLRFSVKSGESFDYLIPASINNNQSATSGYLTIMKNIQNAYDELLALGVPTEDARGVLPMNIFTSIVIGCNYRSLWEMAKQRLCYQSQGEFRELIGKMKKLVGEVHPLLGEYLKPSCEYTHYCSWGGKLDRLCPLQEKYPIHKIN